MVIIKVPAFHSSKVLDRETYLSLKPLTVVFSQEERIVVGVQEEGLEITIKMT